MKKIRRWFNCLFTGHTTIEYHVIHSDGMTMTCHLMCTKCLSITWNKTLQ